MEQSTPSAARPPGRLQVWAPAAVNTRTIQVALVLAQLLYASTFLEGPSPARGIPGIAIGAVFGGLAFWWLRRHAAGRSSRSTALVLAVLAIPGCLLANSVSGVGLVWIAVLALCYELHLGYCIGLIAVLTAAGATLHVIAGSSWATIVSESVGMAFIVGFGIYLAYTLRRITLAEQQRNAALADLEAANRELQQKLATEQDLRVAEERARVAAALHDGLGHRLTGIGMRLDFSERMIEKSPDRARAEIRTARAATGDALDEMRRAVRAMHPVTADTEDPVGSLRSIAASFTSTGLDVAFTTVGGGDLSPETGLLTVRFAQEALTNVVRHSGATRATLRIDTTPSGVTVTLDDNGSGGTQEAGYGIVSLRERAKVLGGTVIARPHGGEDGGFRLELHLPGAGS
ncbi:histidine kinase [Pseudonocardia phyllosphaerae]|uniref:histidine kinase n=1 Tax=Pseudonocardia phyllosphaerae TaxID=3390502 RepID=UPI00397A2DD6